MSEYLGTQLQDDVMRFAYAETADHFATTGSQNLPNSAAMPTYASAASWGSVMAGAAGAAARSLILVMLGILSTRRKHELFSQRARRGYGQISGLACLNPT
jgi:hypothetical protein